MFNTSGAGTCGSLAWNAPTSGLLFNPPPSWGGSRSRGSSLFYQQLALAAIYDREQASGLTAGCGWMEYVGSEEPAVAEAPAASAAGPVVVPPAELVVSPCSFAVAAG